MPKLLYSLICTDIIVDRESGSASYIKVFEHGTVPKLPAAVPPFFVATLWELEPRSQETFTVGLTLVTPDGKKEVLGKNDVAPTGASLHKLNFHLPGLKVQTEGRHRVVISVMQGDKRTVAAQMPLHVFLQQPKETQ
ncbi:MAG: hypothetical protein KKB70_08795 [Proteobacteria bacterium]|nr:hypothetical protein [Pseudomonadota bacterium]MBU1610355.1 hypothetical protein [Pseudomonadota bacterium]